MASRRRLLVAKRIQASAVAMALKNGLGNITTEAISVDAGVSPRTFFNYYPYKEAALLGPPPDYPEEAVEKFVMGTGSLKDDLNEMIRTHVQRFHPEKEMYAAIVTLCDSEPKLMALRGNMIMTRRQRMIEILSRRMPEVDPRIIAILASAILSATNDATQVWARGQANDLVEPALENIALILTAAELLK